MLFDDTQHDSLDRFVRASLARVTLGISPASVMLTYLDWLSSITLSPGTQVHLWQKALKKQLRLAHWTSHSAFDPKAEPCIEPLPQDRRFRDPAWRHFPYNVLYQGFLLQQQWWHNATTGLRGLSPHHEQAIEFGARQWLDVLSPSNYLLTNPVVLERTVTSGGLNLLQGMAHWWEDTQTLWSGKTPAGTEAYVVGRNVAVTPGKVVYRNHLIELIQYTPTTKDVHPEPLLIVPAWIMKYYILDLSPHNSLVKFLVDQGHTVFMISWRNPTEEDRDIGMDDYRRQGILASVDVINHLMSDHKIHAVGYCLGGTLLAITASAMARDDDNRLASITLFAAQTDFREAGELMLFIDDKQLAFLEDLMWAQGMLDTKQMAGAFQILRSNDLIWSRIVNEYLLATRQPMNDLMAWNADATRMPYRMHSEYLRQLFLNNDFAEGRLRVDARPVTFSDIKIPIFCVGTEWDHVAPWRSTYKLHLLADAPEITFLLTNGGHNAGIVSPPEYPRRHYRMTTAYAEDTYIDPDTWLAHTPAQSGSWWPAWQAWLAERSGPRIAAPAVGSRDYPPLDDAPGSYVRQA
ncbi:alpha/beta fold hydrolase [Halomonas sp. McH1-25]|uniref:PHA/PHB synthase family protein n=1 Tax=unclassified Halomonas TaxID=2609666 RepID=UPI001EF6EF40|nr:MULTISPECIES: alpha/beta fold hydrolase [unclassified Halomonas]MCG7600878.1 alpha/beta fold hydrolase [Halomonas sp. McH1-25]MCP1341466.1 alpha/beta fold hydrolase [Halomonas sp. FL8]MCP1360057.1 alpha/beta fold hydrolase [Halomonas sp. BBD45]MCP1364183.1 alpha/beta fold hydrolase [Halomonas sp. BBD48]